MKLSSLLSVLGTAALAAADLRTSAQVYIQPIISSPAAPKPALLADITYDPAFSSSTTASSTSDSSSTAIIQSYEPPELPETASSVRIGLYDKSTQSWLGGTTVASATNFEKGYRPTVTLTVDGKTGEVMSVSVVGVKIDAGVTRDFAPQVVVKVAGRGRQPELNKPVVLNTEGKREVPEVEKPLWQKYWWLLPVVLVLIAGGGGEK